MDIKTKYNIGDVVMCVESIGNGNLFSIRGLLCIARINVEVISPKTTNKKTSVKTVIIQYGFRKNLRSGGDYYWVSEKSIFTHLEEAPAVLSSLGYSLNCKEEKAKIGNGNDFTFLTINDELVDYDTEEDTEDRGVDDIPF